MSGSPGMETRFPCRIASSRLDEMKEGLLSPFPGESRADILIRTNFQPLARPHHEAGCVGHRKADRAQTPGRGLLPGPWQPPEGIANGALHWWCQGSD